MRFLFVLVSACAAAKIPAAGSLTLPLRAGAASTADDPLGAHYRLLLASRNQLCFASTFRDVAGNALGVAWSLGSVEAAGTTRTEKATQVGLWRSVSSENSVRQAEKDTATSRGTQAVMRWGDGGPNGIIPLPQAQSVEETQLALDAELQTYSTIYVCFDAKIVDQETRVVFIQRGDTGILNPQPLRAIWKIAER